jgi:hypothetical protein
MKKQLLSLAFFCSFTSLAVAQDSSLSKEKFREKILQAIPSGSNFIFLDTGSAKLHTDTFYKLPSPFIKAQMLVGNPAADTFYWYLYPKDQFGTVLSAVFTAAFNGAINADTAMYQFSMPLEDSLSGFLIYFYPSSIDTVRSEQLHASLQNSFRATETVFKFESVELEKEVHEPPPPPPPPPKRKRKRQ